MNSKKALISIFMGLIIALPMITFFMPVKEKSELENRYLETAPTPTVENIKDKTFMNKTEKFISDQFLLREALVATRTRLEMAQGNRYINDIFIGDNMLFEKLPTPNEKVMNENAIAINKFAKKYKHNMTTNIMLIPTASEFYPEQLPIFSQKTDQTKLIKSFTNKLNGVNTIDAFAPLSAACDENIFYKTDPHWTSYGAYIGYTALAKTLGFKPVTHDMFNIEHCSSDF
ncbi:MAG: DHHW family protein, partial [Oscillospiraceae bacterium]